MAQSKQSVVTEDRFVSGFTYGDYIAQIKVNQEQFKKNHQAAAVPPNDAEFFQRASRAPGGAARIMVLGEDWCPDVVRGLPVIARIAEAGGIELRIFPRDQHLDIMNEFLNQGQFMSVPTVVFYTRDLRVIDVWFERPKSVDGIRARIEAEIKKEMPGAGEQELRTATRERMSGMNRAIQEATVQEIRELLAAKLRL